MDWSKAKNIIIAMLLAADIAMGAALARDAFAHERGARQAAADAAAFLSAAGMQIEADIPEDSAKLPVIFLKLSRRAEAPREGSYRGTPIVVRSEDMGFEVSGEGEQAARTISASEALLKLYASMASDGESVGGKSLDSIQLVYLTDEEYSSYMASDTASPAWEIVLSGEAHYVNAYGE